jgi:hypothetical protein
LRDRAISDGQHARTPGIVADLALGLRYLLDFAEASGAIDAARRRELWERGWTALCQAGAAQAEHGRAADPVEQFLRQLSAALASGRAHVAAPEGMEPKPHPAAWGWRGKEYTFSGADGPETDISWMAQGRRVGWIDGEALYLEPEASYAAAQELARDQGDGLAVSARTLWRRLRERRLLASWDERRQRNTIRRTLEGVRDCEVLHLCADALCPSTGPSEPSAEAENPLISAEMRTVSADGPADGNGVCRENRPQEPSAETEENSACGRCGQSPTGRDASRNGNPAGYLAPGLTQDEARTPFDDSERGS